mgnify:CR=1 FL=1
MPTLTLKRNDAADKSLEIGSKPLVIGRVAESDIMVRDSFVSRVHAGIGYADNQFTLKDLGSTNGTYRNGARVFQCVLANGDRIQVGNTTLIFETTGADTAILQHVPQIVAPASGTAGGVLQRPGLKQVTAPVKMPTLPPRPPGAQRAGS